MRVWWLVALMGALPSAALAQDHDVGAGIEWQVPPECPGRDVLLARLDVAVDGLASHPATATWSITIRVTADPWTVLVRTRIDGLGGERQVGAADCDAATNAAVLVVALALADAEDAPPGTDIVFPEEPAPPGEDDLGRQGATGGTWLSASAGPSWGVLPDVGTSAALRVDWSEAFWRAGIGVRGFPHGAIYVAGQSASIALGLVSLAPRGCLEARFDVVALGGCVELDVGVVVAAASGLDGARTVVLPWVSGGLALTSAIELDVVRFELAGGVFGTPTRPLLTIGTDAVYQAEPIEVWGTLGLAVRFDTFSTSG